MKSIFNKLLIIALMGAMAQPAHAMVRYVPWYKTTTGKTVLGAGIVAVLGATAWYVYKWFKTPKKAADKPAQEKPATAAETAPADVPVVVSQENTDTPATQLNPSGDKVETPARSATPPLLPAFPVNFIVAKDLPAEQARLLKISKRSAEEQTRLDQVSARLKEIMDDNKEAAQDKDAKAATAAATAQTRDAGKTTPAAISSRALSVAFQTKLSASASSTPTPREQSPAKRTAPATVPTTPAASASGMLTQQQAPAKKPAPAKKSPAKKKQEELKAQEDKIAADRAIFKATVHRLAKEPVKTS